MYWKQPECKKYQHNLIYSYYSHPWGWTPSYSWHFHPKSSAVRVFRCRTRVICCSRTARFPSVAWNTRYNLNKSVYISNFLLIYFTLNDDATTMIHWVAINETSHSFDCSLYTSPYLGCIGAGGVCGAFLYGGLDAGNRLWQWSSLATPIIITVF